MKKSPGIDTKNFGENLVKRGLVKPEDYGKWFRFQADFQVGQDSVKTGSQSLEKLG